MSVDLNIIVLAAGYGQRMVSSLPKVLHPVGGQPMLARILRAIKDTYSKEVRVVVGHASHLVTPIAGKFNALCFEQEKDSRGTAKAVLAARPKEFKGDVLIINGDHPLITGKDITSFVRSFYDLSVDCAVASFKNPHPSEFGRLVFEENQLVEIVEAYDIEKRKIKSEYVNAGLYLIKGNLLSKYLNQIQKNHNEEYNFTDIIQLLNKDKYKVRGIGVPWYMAFGVNNQQELAIASSVVFENKCYELMSKGVIIVDFKKTYIESDVIVGSGTMIYPGVYLKGQTKIGSFCAIESNAFIFDSVIDNYVNIKMGSYLESATVKERSAIGPYAHLRPGTVIGKQCRIGNFVETKNIKMGDKSKAAHLTYLGDAEIGEEVNIGCGTVTCNYDVDKKKNQTKIGDKVFVGSGVQLVAPVHIKNESVIGAGSVITKDVPEGYLALERSEQKNIKDYKTKKEN